MRVAGCIGAIAAFGVLLSSSAFGISFDDLKGYSFEITQARYAAYRDGSYGWSVTKKIYISRLGNIFSYRATGTTVTQLDQAASLSGERLEAYTMDGGLFTSISRQIEGFVVETIVVDPSRSNCTSTFTTRPDPTTGRLVADIHGYHREMSSYTVRSATCTIKKGNIFASEQ